MESIIEEWRDIVGYEGLYQVSNLGRVKSLRDWAGNKYAAKYISRELIMKPTDNGNGYFLVFLQKETKRHRHYVHRLVASAFIPNPDGLPVVNHLDYDKHNNAITNLEWCTTKENVNYSVERMRKRKAVTHASTGEQYIYYRASKGLYRVVVDHKEYKAAKTLEEAVKIRDEILSREVV